jgi:hypothetical protein
LPVTGLKEFVGGVLVNLNAAIVRSIGRLFMAGVIGSASLLAESSQQPSWVKVFGLVKDTNGAVVPTTKLVFNGEGGAWEVRTNEEGTYNIELPAGTYHATAEADWFCPVRRPSFRAQLGSSIKLDFSLDVCPIVNSATTVHGQYKEIEQRVPPFKEEVVLLKRFAPFELLIHFGRRTENRRRGLAQYDMIKTMDGKCLPVVVMYDLLTVKAKTVKLDRHNGRLAAEGNVSVYQNEQIDFGASAQIEFMNGSPTVTLKH